MIVAASEIDLINTLATHAQDWVKDFRFNSSIPNTEEWVAPEVYKYFLPQQQATQAQPQYPAVIVLPTHGNDDFDTASNWGSSQCTVAMAVRVGDKNLIDRVEFTLAVILAIKNKLLQHKTIANQYTLQFPLHWQLYDDEQAPQFGGQLTTTWEFPSFQEPVSF